MLLDAPAFSVSLARTEEDIRAAQRLRYEVFVEELGGDGPDVDHDQKQEIDPFDRFADHLILRTAPLEHESDGQVIGVYRLMTHAQAQLAGRFYSESEFDLTPLLTGAHRVLELGRSCLHRDYRRGAALQALWQGLADYVADKKIDILFGVASFHGTDVAKNRNALSHLHKAHLAPSEIRATSLTPDAFDPLPADTIDRKAAMRDTPALIKSYLKLGGTIGQGVFIDHAFNTTDVCMILQTNGLPVTPPSPRRAA